MQRALLRDKSIVLFGFGREGRAAYDVLTSYGCSVVVTDDGAVQMPEFVEPAHVTVDAATVIIKSPGIPPHHPLLGAWKAKGATITSSTNIFLAERKGRGRIIGVTGTKGKSTTSSLLAHALMRAGFPVVLVGNIGTPAITHIDAPDDTVFVMELSSYQLNDLAVAPDIGVILNVYEEHMNWHGSVAAYQEAKLRMGRVMREGDVLVYNPAFPMLVALAQSVSCTTVPFVAAGPALDALTIRGEHNRDNARAVLTVTDVLGVDRAVVADAFASFVPLPHRMEEIPSGDLLFVNDSISTTPQSALAAIAVYAERLRVIILGGQDRGYDFTALAKRLADLPQVTVLVMPGGERVSAALVAYGVRALPVATLPEAVHEARRVMRTGDVCLLSPASPSYGQFRNFEDRGEQFRVAVVASTER